MERQRRQKSTVCINENTLGTFTGSFSGTFIGSTAALLKVYSIVLGNGYWFVLANVFRFVLVCEDQSLEHFFLPPRKTCVT